MKIALKPEEFPVIRIAITFLSLLLIVGGCKKEEPPKMTSAKPVTPEPTMTPVSKSGISNYMPSDTSHGKLTPPTLDDIGDRDEVAVLETAKGDIVVEFFPDKAPWHVASFKKLIRSGFFDGTYFHRVLPEFVVQGGDPNTKDLEPRNDGIGGPPWSVNAEFNDIPHDKGILSMARSQDPNSAGSQFFICLGRERTRHLDGQYSVFGKVIKGLEVAENIGKFKRDPSNPADRKLPAVTLHKVRLVKHSEAGL